jgi:predicted DNA-binding transcriptional regulator YafY
MSASDTSGRLLRLLSLLQSRPVWQAAEVAERLGVTTRTVRRDMVRLRDLGYPVEAEPGPHGGYQLGRGGSLPPLLLDDDEAVAVAVGLRAAADGSVVGLDDATVSALAKLDQVLPTALAQRVRAVHGSTVSLAGRDPETIDAGVLVALAQACRATNRLRFMYATHAGHRGGRTVDPHRLVRWSGRWYLVARDVDRGEWRTYRVDRITAVEVLALRVVLVDPPDPAELVSRGMAVAPYTIQARVRLPLPPDEALSVLPRTMGVVESSDERGTVVATGANDLEGLAAFLAGLRAVVEVLEPPELRAAVARRAARLAAANEGPLSPDRAAGGGR